MRIHGITIVLTNKKKTQLSQPDTNSEFEQSQLQKFVKEDFPSLRMYFSNVRVYLYLHVTSIFLLDHFLLYDVVHIADPLARHPHLFLQDDLLLDGTLQDSNTRHNASVTEH